MKSVLNRKIVDPLTQPLFLGEDLSLQRYDRIKYKAFYDLYDKQLQLFWRPQEIELKKDRNDFKNLLDHEKFIFTANLQYQTMLDTVISRGVPVLLEHITNPELEACCNVWQMFETLHSNSYSYIIQNVYDNAGEVFDKILEDKEILKRAENAVSAYDDLMLWQPPEDGKEDQVLSLKDQIYLTIISINILESVRFYVSFVCAFNFGESKRMIGNAEIVRLIKRDEAQHVHITQSIAKVLRTEESEGFTDVVKKHENTVVKMFEEAVQEEIEWTEYLCKDGSLLGLSPATLAKYIKYLADTRLVGLGLPKQYGEKNPLGGWLDHWMSSSGEQTAPQETEITTYKIAASKNDIAGAFGGIEL